MAVIYYKVLKRIAGIITRRHHHPRLHHRHHHHHRALPDKTDQWACLDLQGQMDQKVPQDPQVFPDHPAYQDTQETPPDPPEGTGHPALRDQPEVKARPETWGRWELPEEQGVPEHTCTLPENEDGRQRNLEKLQD